MRARLVAAAAVALSLAVSLADAREAGWRVERLAKLHSGAYYTHVAIAGNAEGRRVAVWFDDGVRAAVAQPGHGFGPPRLLRHEASSVSTPRVVVNARGAALIVWNYLDETYKADDELRDEDCCFGARAVVLHRDGHLGRIKTLTRRGIPVDVGGLAIDSHGHYGVVWRAPTARGGARGRFSGHGGLGEVRRIDSEGMPLALAFVHGRPRVLIHSIGHRKGRVVERIAHHNGRFGARRTVARGLGRHAFVFAAANERGDEAVAWGPEGYSADLPLHAGTRAPGERLASRVIARVAGGYPQTIVSMSPSGAAVVAWAPTYGGLWLARSPGAGRRFRHASPVVRMHNDNWLDELEVAADERGRAALAWTMDGGPLHFALVGTTGHVMRHERSSGRYTYLGPQGTGTFDRRGRASLILVKGSAVRVAQLRVDR